MFSHKCANAILSLKGLEGPLLFVLVTFLQDKNSITLQRLQASSISSRAVVVGLTSSRLPPLQDTSPISTIDLLQVIDLLVNIATGSLNLQNFQHLMFAYHSFTIILTLATT